MHKPRTYVVPISNTVDEERFVSPAAAAVSIKFDMKHPMTYVPAYGDQLTAIDSSVFCSEWMIRMR
jgi:hypothetical protein